MSNKKVYNVLVEITARDEVLVIAEDKQEAKRIAMNVFSCGLSNYKPTAYVVEENEKWEYFTDDESDIHQDDEEIDFLAAVNGEQ